MKRKIGILLAMSMMVGVGGWAEAVSGPACATRSAGQQEVTAAAAAPMISFAASAMPSACINSCKIYNGKRCTGSQQVSCVYSTCTSWTCFCEAGTYLCLP